MTPPPEGLSDSGRAAWPRLFGPAVTHRGLWSAERPENSLAAFDAAAEAGYGVELDVRLARDGEAVVFHDEQLRRMTGASGRLGDSTAAELQALRLRGSEEAIPTLAQALQQIAGRSLVLIEVKASHARRSALEARIAEALDGYDGPVAVISSGRDTHDWFARERPNCLRGVHFDLSDLYFDKASEVGAHFVLPALEVLRLPTTQDLRRRGLPLIAWTTRTSDQARRALRYADNIIFEGFEP